MGTLRDYAKYMKGEKAMALKEEVARVGKQLQEVGFDCADGDAVYIFYDDELGVKTTIIIGNETSTLTADYRVDNQNDTWASYWSTNDELSVQLNNNVVVEDAVTYTKRMIEGKHPFDDDCICDDDADIE